MRTIIFFLLCIQLSLSTGCTLVRANIHHKSLETEFAMKDGAWQGQELGPVMGHEGDNIVGDCTQAAVAAMREMIKHAKKKGANAIGNIKWDTSRNSSVKCRKNWGYVVIPPMLLTPMFMTAIVTGTAYYVVNLDQNSLAGVFALPNSAKEESIFISRLLSPTSLL